MPSHHHNWEPNLTVLSEAAGSAVLSIRASANLRGLLAAGIALEAIAGLALVLTSVDNLAGISVVGVDAAEDTAVDSHRVLDDEVTGTTVALAVTAAARELAVVVGIEVLDVDGAAAVELEDLVAGVESATAVDVGSSAGLLEGCGVFADVGPPDVVQGAVDC